MTYSSHHEAEVLPEEVQWVLQRADGFTDLRLYARAHETMKSIPESHRASLPYRFLELRLAMAEAAWATAQELAQALRDAHPEHAFLWIQLAYATRRAQGLPEAQAILVDATAVFPDEALIPYNLSCYACRDGELSVARDYLKRAFALDGAYRILAMEDEDLEQLWLEIEDL